MHIFLTNLNDSDIIVDTNCYAPIIRLFNYTHSSDVFSRFRVLRPLEELHGMGPMMGIVGPRGDQFGVPGGRA